MNKFISPLIQSDKIIHTFIRAQLSSGLSAIVDLGSRLLFFSIILSYLPEFYRANISVGIGTILGGVFQCVVNYKFTFHAKGHNLYNIALKFFVVWIGNILLNMYGTTLLYEFVNNKDLIVFNTFSKDIVFGITTLFIAISVSLIWNFPMQKFFVYREISLKDIQKRN